MTTTYKPKNRIFPTILCVLLCALFAVLAVPGQTVRADEAEYSILDDFAGTDFDISEYPEDPNDSSLSVVHIAETTSNELAVYVYQPSADKNNILATSINISTASGDTPKYTRYALELLGSSDTVFKYLVKDLAVSSGPIRYYSISSISRQWIKDIDDPLENNNTASTVAYSVGQNGRRYCLTVLSAIFANKRISSRSRINTSAFCATPTALNSFRTAVTVIMWLFQRI